MVMEEEKHKLTDDLCQKQLVDPHHILVDGRNSKQGDGQKQKNMNEHLQLAAIIKGVHRQLRREYRANAKEHEKVWQQHTENEACLERYAKAMYRLATEHWSVNPATRIHWCRQVMLEYFLQGGRRIALEKDAKRVYHEKLRRNHQMNDADASNTTPTVFANDKSCDRLEANVESDIKPEIKQSVTGKIRLLDVGSCYNPFLEFEEFDAVGIDLSPAKQTVLKCDFLQLSTYEHPDPLNFDLHDLASPVTRLPGQSFHAVIFSLLLEYLPSPAQRWQCCTTAHSLLSSSGLLLVITPDSHSQHRNAPMMRSWRQAIESIGFRRWKYQKQDHIHCIAFRKVCDPHPRPTGEDRFVDMLYIPQDLTDACYDDTPSGPVGEDNEEKLNEFLSMASELPALEDDV
ncbi:S-adenosylmethionine sensor upstream of mTORC1-like isoform X2 [Physella acuta]|uniref:S-adenosylmethionine sensor upstream of mTORC1-like isoform X2 n=1 Tax=Physella acuta TaxID=109671 RepID=UPI0027DD21E9|nr:S-adenosylmethionine sensor upstream of mTORC1-like isoform X2 [Physella acuta]